MKTTGKILKKIVIILVALIFLLIGSLIAIPYFFKDEIREIALEYINKDPSMQVDLADIELSMFADFPNLTVSLIGILAENRLGFDNDTVAYIESLSVSLNLKDVIDENYAVKNLHIASPKLFLQTRGDGLTNYLFSDGSVPVRDSLIEEQEAKIQEPAPQQSDSISFSLDQLSITNFSIVYDDQLSNMYAEYKGDEMRFQVKLNGSKAEIEIDLVETLLDFVFEGSQYAKNLSVEFDSRLSGDLDSNSYSFLENRLSLGGLILQFSGDIVLNDDIYTDIKLSTPSTEFKQLLALIPKEFQHYLDGVETSGTFSLNAFAKGVYNQSTMPAFNLALNIENGTLQYPDLPQKLSDIGLVMTIDKPQGDLNEMEITISSMKANAGGNTFSSQLLIKEPMSDPWIDGNLVTNVNFRTLGDVIPLEGMSLKGELSTELNFTFTVNQVMNELYEKIKFVGNLTLKDFLLQDKELPGDVILPLTKMDFTPRTINLSLSNGKLGKTDFSLRGTVTNYLQYALRDQPLRGRLTLTSNNIDVNDLMSAETEPTTSSSESASASATSTTSSEEPLAVVEIPANLDIVFTASLKHILYDNLDISDFKGGLTLNNGVLFFNKTSMKMIGGAVSLSGQYHAKQKDKPYYAYKMNMSNLNFQKAYKELSIISHYLPIAKKANGDFSASIDLDGYLTSAMEPRMNTINGTGTLGSKNLKLEDVEQLGKIAQALKKPNASTTTISPFTINYTIKDGNLEIPQETINMLSRDFTISGKVSLEQKLDLLLSSYLTKTEIVSWTKASGKLVQYIPERVNVPITIKGEMSNPDVGIDNSWQQEVMNAAKKQLEAEAKKELNKHTDKLKEEGKKAVEKKAKELLKKIKF